MTMTRRKLVQLAAGASVAATLAACAGQSGPTIAQDVITALQAVAAEVNQIVPQLVAAGLGGNTLTSVQEVVSEMQQALSGVSSAMTQTQGESVLLQVEGYINALAPLVLPFVSLIPGGTIIGMIVAALPAIEALVNVAVTALSSVAQSLAQTAPATAASGRLRALPSAAQSAQYLVLLEQRAGVYRAGRRLRRQ